MACLVSVDVEIGLQRCYLHMSIVGVRGAAGLLSTGHAGARVQGLAGGGGDSHVDQPHPNPNIYLFSVRCHTFMWLAHIRPVMVASGLHCSQLTFRVHSGSGEHNRKGAKMGFILSSKKQERPRHRRLFHVDVRYAETWEAT